MNNDPIKIELPEGMTPEEFEALLTRWEAHGPTEGTCPKCYQEISHLYEIVTVLSKIVFEVTPKGNPNYGDMETGDVPMDSQGFVCPECGEEVAKTEEEAIKILTGGPK